MSLYQITQELQSLINLADQCVGDEEMSKAVQEHMAAIDEALESKAESYACLIRTLEARADARKQEASRMAALAKADAALADRLKFYLRDSMIRTGRTKINTDKFRLSVVANGGKIPIQILSEEDLPKQYMTVTMTELPNKDAIRSALEAGVQVPGVRLGDRGTRLDIK